MVLDRNRPVVIDLEVESPSTGRWNLDFDPAKEREEKEIQRMIEEARKRRPHVPAQPSTQRSTSTVYRADQYTNQHPHVPGQKPTATVSRHDQPVTPTVARYDQPTTSTVGRHDQPTSTTHRPEEPITY